MVGQNALSGVAYISVNGSTTEVVADCTWSSQTYVNETLKSLSDPAPGYRQVPLAPFIEINTRDLGDVPLSNFYSLDGATVVLQLANGKVITGQSMWVVENMSVNSGDTGAFRLRFEGPAVTETLA
jgi:hypothetical protein